MHKLSEIRGLLGVVCSITRSDQGQLTLFFDDVVNGSGSGLGPWTNRNPYTSLQVQSETGEWLHTLSEQDLANIGLSIVARLAALQQHEA
jgi:hypothetical protein